MTIRTWSTWLIGSSRQAWPQESRSHTWRERSKCWVSHGRADGEGIREGLEGPGISLCLVPLADGRHRAPFVAGEAVSLTALDLIEIVIRSASWICLLLGATAVSVFLGAEVNGATHSVFLTLASGLAVYVACW